MVIYGGFYWTVHRGEIHFGCHLDLATNKARIWRREQWERGSYNCWTATWDPWRERLTGPRIIEEDAHNARFYDLLEEELRAALLRAWAAAHNMSLATVRRLEARIYQIRRDRERDEYPNRLRPLARVGTK
jgi:hypothetical protein